MRHGIHESAYFDVDGDDLWEYSWPPFKAWSFIAWFGVGIEGRRFSMEFRWMEYSGEYSGDAGGAQDFRRNWRLTFGFGL